MKIPQKWQIPLSSVNSSLCKLYGARRAGNQKMTISIRASFSLTLGLFWQFNRQFFCQFVSFFAP